MSFCYFDLRVPDLMAECSRPMDPCPSVVVATRGSLPAYPADMIDGVAILRMAVQPVDPPADL